MTREELNDMLLDLLLYFEQVLKNYEFYGDDKFSSVQSTYYFIWLQQK